MSQKLKKSLICTLCYADVFDYPLTRKELCRRLIWPQKKPLLPRSAIIQALSHPLIQKTGSYYHLKNRKKIVALRHQRQRYSRQKYLIAKRIGQWLKLIPTIKMTCLTGALAVKNCQKNDDIDLMIVTAKNRLWLTRPFVTVLISLIAQRRHPGPPPIKHNNAVCLNLWLDESALRLPQSKRSLYSAYEISQAQPLWSRGDTYQKFLNHNFPWVKKYLPLAFKKPILPQPSSKTLVKQNFLDKFNLLAFKLQFRYMRSKITQEKVNPHFAFFHPRLTAKIILNQYKKRVLLYFSSS